MSLSTFYYFILFYPSTSYLKLRTNSIRRTAHRGNKLPGESLPTMAQAETSQLKVKIPDVDSTNLASWIRRHKKACKFNKLSNSEMMDMIPFHLTGVMADWNELKTTLLARFGTSMEAGHSSRIQTN
ncbi:unnamed protein product [Absidia cylindrospora]